MEIYLEKVGVSGVGEEGCVEGEVVALERYSTRCAISGGGGDGDGLGHHECDGELKLPGMQVKSGDASNRRTVRKGLPVADVHTCCFLILSSSAVLSPDPHPRCCLFQPAACRPRCVHRTAAVSHHHHAPAQAEKRERQTKRRRQLRLQLVIEEETNLVWNHQKGNLEETELSGIIGRRLLPSYT
jgi:hypothetical protein